MHIERLAEGHRSTMALENYRLVDNDAKFSVRSWATRSNKYCRIDSFGANDSLTFDELVASFVE